MNVFILHAEKNQAAADDLKAFLKSHGIVVETETGARGFRHLQKSDVVVALWSNDSVFSVHRMMAEKRMFEAWEEGRLVLVKLDHAFLPVGLRDLPALDASFEANRKLSVWPQVERQAKEKMNAARIQPPPPQQRARSAPAGSGGSSAAEQTAAPSELAAAPRKPGGVLPVIFLAVAVSALAWAGWRFWVRPDDAETTRVMTYVTYGVAVLGVLLLLTIIAQLFRPPFGRTAMKERAASAAAPAPAAPIASDALFVSYAHADAPKVDPVVKIVEDAGRTVWVDKGGIQPGESWAGEIVRAIKGSKGVVIMCSPQAFESDHIKREVYLADRYKKPMLPMFLEPAPIPEDFEYFFAGVQWLELFKLNEADRRAAIGKALSSV